MTPEKNGWRHKQYGNAVVYALFLSFCLHLLHLEALPLVISFDGHLYYELSTLPGSGHFFRDFDFLRTPLFPLALRGSFWLLGEQPDSVLILNALFSFVAICVLAVPVRILGGTIAAVFCILGLTLWPLSIAYQHTFLSESSSACMLACIAAALFLFVRRPGYRSCVLLSGVLTLAYYFRPSFLYIAPGCSLLVLLLPFARNGSPVRPRFRFSLAAAALITAIPLLLSSPWRAETAKSGRMGGIYHFGMVNQGLVPPEDIEDLGGAQTLYIKGIERARQTGQLDAAGIVDTDVMNIMNAMPSHVTKDGAAVFKKLVLQNPFRYAKGIVRTMMLFFGARALESENDLFSHLALSGTEHQVILIGPEHLRAIVSERFSKRPVPSGFQRFEESIGSVTSQKRFILAMNCCSLLLLFVSIIRRNVLLAILPFLVVAFYGLHALTLLSLDRYAFPAYFLLVASTSIFLSRLIHWVVSPVVVEKVHPARETDERLRSLLEMETMKKAVDDRSKNDPGDNDKRKAAV